MARRKPKWRKAKETAGCEFCGRRLPPSIKKGLDYCHIIAERYFTGGDPDKSQENGFILCSICHDLFDHIIKPKLEAARIWSKMPKSSASRIPICSSDTDFLNRLT